MSGTTTVVGIDSREGVLTLSDAGEVCDFPTTYEWLFVPGDAAGWHNGIRLTATMGGHRVRRGHKRKFRRHLKAKRGNQ